MEQVEKRRSATHYLRVLHRDVGYLLVGMTLVFSLGGILLIYRDTDFLQYDTTSVRTLAPGLSAEDIGKALHLMEIKVSGDDGKHVLFSDEPYVLNGTYDRDTGSTTVTEKRLPALLDKITTLHRAASAQSIHWIALIYGVLLSFLAISSFWMFKPSTRQFRRGLSFAALGVFFTAALVSIV